MAENLRDVRLRIGRKVRQLRRSYGLTQEQLARLVGNQQKHIGQVERGQVNVSIDVLARIAERLSVDVSELVRPATSDEIDADSYVIPRQLLNQIEEALKALERVKRATGRRQRANPE